MLQKKTIYCKNLQLLPSKFLNNLGKNRNVHATLKVAYFVFLDMIKLTKMWRHIKGYPANGQTTYTNAHSSKKNKILLNFRLEQFYAVFGQKKRNIFPTLIQAEYNNRLWFTMWHDEWLQASQFLLTLVNPNKQTISFDPVHLAKGQTNGYVRVGAASKVGKAKQITKQGTIGVPIFFTRYIYADILPISFPYKLTIADELRRKMGKKKKKKKW